MDALSIARAMGQPSEVKTPTTPLPESTKTETPVAPVTTETQEPVAPAAGETKPETTVGEPAKPETSTATETKPAEKARDWRIDAFYKAQRELEELKAKAVAPPAATTPEPAKPVVAAAVEDVEPTWDPEKYPNGYDDFIRALAIHHGVKAAKEIAKTGKVSDAQEQFNRQVEEQKAKFRQSVIENGVTDYWDVVPKMVVKFNEDFVGECVNSPVGPKILHFLATNPEEAIRIDGLGKRAQFREFEALENRFKSAPTGAPATPPVAPAVPFLNPGVSKAPAPIPTLATGVTKPPRKSDAELAVSSPEEWQAAHPEIVVHRGRHARR